MTLQLKQTVCREWSTGDLSSTSKGGQGVCNRSLIACRWRGVQSLKRFDPSTFSSPHCHCCYRRHNHENVEKETLAQEAPPHTALTRRQPQGGCRTATLKYINTNIFYQIYVIKHVKHISPIPYIYNQISNSTNSRYISFHIFRLWSMFWWSRKLTCPRPRKAARWGERFRSKKWQTACARKSFCCNWATGWWWWWWWCQHCQPASTPPALSSFSWWKPALCSQSTSWEAIESWKMCLKCWKPTKVQTKSPVHPLLHKESVHRLELGEPLLNHKGDFTHANLESVVRPSSPHKHEK